MAEKKNDKSPRIVNRKARHDYFIESSMEVGIALRGSEVKSIRNGQVSLAEGFARIDPKTMELTLLNVNIAIYPQAGPTNTHEPTRPRKLLAHKREIGKLFDETSASGATLVPLTMYFTRGKVKIELGVAKGKAHQDKRETIKKADINREIRRHLSRKVR